MSGVFYSMPKFVAGGSVRPGRLLKVTGAFQVEECGANQLAIGVSHLPLRSPAIVNMTSETNVATTGEPVPIITYGEALVEAGGAINAGDWVKSDAQGRAVAASGAGTHNCVGVALESAVGAGSWLRVFVMPRPVTLT